MLVRGPWLWLQVLAVFFANGADGLPPDVIPLVDGCYPTRDQRPMVILHIPKTGGTTICKGLVATNQCVAQSRAKGNCWVTSDGPEWCCLPTRVAKRKTCEKRRAYPNAVTMIERYMDTDPTTNQTLFCDGVTYGIILREPVSRAISQVHEFVAMLRSASRHIFVEFLVRHPPHDVQAFFEKLDGIPAFSKDSKDLIMNVLGEYSMGIEENCYKINAFTSNYLTRVSCTTLVRWGHSFHLCCFK